MENLDNNVVLVEPLQSWTKAERSDNYPPALILYLGILHLKIFWYSLETIDSKLFMWPEFADLALFEQ